VVRRVPLGRRDASRRARRWAGPPPLLLLATVLGFAMAPMLDRGPGEPVPQALTVAQTVSPRAVEPHVLRPQALQRSRGGTVATGIKPVQLKPVRVGVASLNMYRHLSSAQAGGDARTLTRLPAVDVVGWQEADRFRAVLHALRGWDTRTFDFGRATSELAVSWRRSEFTLVSAEQRSVANGVGWQDGLHPFPDRLVAVVTLRHRATGRTLTVVDTHLPQAIEDLDRPGHWLPTINAYRARRQLAAVAATFRRAAGRWVVGTGDYNMDARADARRRPPGGPRRALAGTAVSSYQVLGSDVAPTHPPTGRRIDYVWADRAGVRDGRIDLSRQFVVGRLASDHNALVARLVLS
jgi:endonuclease/exonuclease/phosphatase family metal-dependent hydrolase